MRVAKEKNKLGQVIGGLRPGLVKCNVWVEAGDEDLGTHEDLWNEEIFAREHVIRIALHNRNIESEKSREFLEDKECSVIYFVDGRLIICDLDYRTAIKEVFGV